MYGHSPTVLVQLGQVKQYARVYVEEDLMTRTTKVSFHPDCPAIAALVEERVAFRVGQVLAAQHVTLDDVMRKWR